MGEDIPCSAWVRIERIPFNSRNAIASTFHAFEEWSTDACFSPWAVAATVLININPSEETANIIHKVQADADLRNSNEGRHWLSLFGMGPEAYRFGGLNLAVQLRQWKKSEIENGVNRFQVQGVLLSQAEVLLRLSDDTFEHWNQFLLYLETPLTSYVDIEDKIAWAKSTRPVSENIISYISSLRTPYRQQDPDRQSSVLPPVFPLRLWLLSYLNPHSSTSSTDIDRFETYQVFAEQLASYYYSELAVAGNNRSSVLNFAEALQYLSTAAVKGCSSDWATLSVAHYHGNFDLDLDLREDLAFSAPSLHLETGGFIKLELAKRFLLKIQKDSVDGKSKEFQQVVEMVENWKRSVNEGVRMRGFRAAKRL